VTLKNGYNTFYVRHVNLRPFDADVDKFYRWRENSREESSIKELRESMRVGKTN